MNARRTLRRFDARRASRTVSPPRCSTARRRASDAPLARLTAQPGFAVYRNTVLKGCIDALPANYPAVLRLVGEEWFRAAAAIYVREHLPRQPMLFDYGEGLAGFWPSSNRRRELPYLAAVAQLDRLWSEAHFAPDEAPLDAAARDAGAGATGEHDAAAPCLGALGSGSTRCRSAPSGSAIGPPTTGAMRFDGDIDWQGEGVLMTRPLGPVE